MMTTILKLYSKTQLKEDKNFCLDSTATTDIAYLPKYLLNKLTYTVNNFQLFKPLLDLSIKVNLTQDNLYGFSTALYKDVDYVSFTPNKTIEGETPVEGRTFYYFVIAKRWTAESTLSLELRMDTLNTFKLGTDYVMTPRTIVEREHKDRFVKLNNPRTINIFASDRIIRQTKETYDGGEYDSVAFFEIETGIKCKEIPNFSPEYFSLTYDTDYTCSEPFNVAVEDKEYRFNGDDYELVIRLYVGFDGVGPGYDMNLEISNLKLFSRIEMVRNIDFYPEGLSPVLYKKGEQILRDKLDTAWNLAYLSGASESDPIICQLIPDSTIKAIIPVSKLTIVPASLTANKIYYIYQNPTEMQNSVPLPLEGGNSNSISVNIGGNVYNLLTSFKKASGPYGAIIGFAHIYTFLQFKLEGASIRYEIIQREYDYSFDDEGNTSLYNTRDVLITSGLVASFFFESANELNYTDYDINTYVFSNGTFTTTPTELTIKNINEYDRTNSKLNKIIKLPYAPTSYSYKEGTIPELTFDSDWNTDSLNYIFVLNDLNAKFKNHIEYGYNPIYETLVNQLYGGNAFLRNDENESKLFHSDFYQVKFVYDSFTFVFQLERINEQAYFETSNSMFQFNFVTTSTINSKFLFEFPNYILKYSTEDYDNILPVARNNEVTIYNSEYLNYLRTAYHYDLKAKERTISTARLGLGLGIVSGFTSAGVGLLGGGSPYSKFSAVSNAGTSIVSGIVNTINTIASAEEQFASKQESMKAQSFSVSGSDDVDLMEYYSGNRAKLVVYAVSERMKKALADLFYYCGYATNEQKIPNVKTRFYFNYLKCQLSLKDICYNEDVTNDLIAKYNEGVTFIHKLYSSQYDIEKIFERENQELSLLN